MIEYKQSKSLSWIKMSDDITVNRLYFINYIVRIGGVIYTENNAEFREAFEKEEFWSKLRD